MKAFVLIAVCFLNYVKSEGNPSINTPLGKIEGGVGTTLNGRTYFSYEGVPYAKPPVGKRRFQAPVPGKPWKFTWIARTVHKCLQHYQFTPPGEDSIIGEEDCLYLNIYTPTTEPGANLDVVVYFHGGAFMFNWAAKTGPKYILDKDVVYVNVNYRLGPFGFLSTENDLIPGNNGMRDQILALQWIKNNIKSFGGNPNSVTISGMSAGGASVHFHYLSPKSRGLFHKGISQSGTMLNTWVLMEQPLEKTKKLARAVGCPTKKLQTLVECLSRRPGRQIAAAVKEFQPWLYNPFSPFGLVVDSWSSDPVLPSHPLKLLKDKQVHDVPWMASHTDSEGLYPAAEFLSQDKYFQDLDSRWNELAPLILDYNYTVNANLRDDVSEKIRQHYFGDKPISRETRRELINLCSERHFVVDIQKTVRLHSRAVSSPVYFYYFSYRGSESWSEMWGDEEDLGASHADDTAYIFSIPGLDTSSTEDGRQMIKLFVDLFTSFAKNGQPDVGVEWPPVGGDPQKFYYLDINSPRNSSAKLGAYSVSEFWGSLPLVENEKLFVTAKDEL